MTLWNTGYFLVVKKKWMGLTILFVAGFALWGLVDLLRRCHATLPRFYRRLWSIAAQHTCSPA
jgi:hypothetical protein